MNKIAIVYWSQTGNTESMAQALFDAAKAKGKDAKLSFVSDFDTTTLDDYDLLAFGCPSMGIEVLEEAEFEPFFSSIEDQLEGKNVLLFGSYGWGDGQWMRDWEERVKSKGANLLNDEGIICQETPDNETLEKLKSCI